MIWLAWVGLSAIVAALLFFFGKLEREAVIGLATICGGLVLVWAGQAVISERAYWVFSALIWVVIAGFISINGSGYSIASGLFLIGAGILVLPARLSGGGYEYGNFWLMGSDVLGVCAILAFGWPVATDIADRMGSLANRDRLSDRGSGVSARSGDQETQN